MSLQFALGFLVVLSILGGIGYLLGAYAGKILFKDEDD